MKRLLLIVPTMVLTLVGCARTPTWSNANARQRAAGDFKYDWPYFESAQCTNDTSEDYGTIIRLRHQIHGEPLYDVTPEP